ncbi:Fe(3+) ABC transporter substrate-binding protein [Yoonia vestfoldensis]|uniref:ABC Fe+3 siderophore transporter, periplasmic substrate-binding protein n=1 Tax=Yoonia vestfoldensis SKA53 TaxID=314232 RepID=A3V6F6_9RHOB|nr:Fe(3+) ABC transporter substrate-binding protein [Yoonia vestfoldensis]EAQ06480.1 ABC Fe+3 siderophore transporter, periplasmic substrate-binding protein [Yoonia vestfoldensis SKA53]
MNLRHILLASTCAAIAGPAIADVNIYTTREPVLIQPVMDAFTAETGIAVNLSYIDDGLVERLTAEGARSPADLVMTVDIANLKQIVDAGVVQAVESDVLNAAIPAELRSDENLWFGLTTRARIIYASKDRVADGEVTTYEDLTSDKWEGRICSRSGLNNYSLALLSAVIAHKGEDGAREWAAGLRENLARKPEGNDRAQVRAIWAGECDISLGNTYYMGGMLADPEQQEWANSVRIIFPTFQDGGTHVNVSGVAMTQSAPNRDEAVQLMEFLVSPDAQAIYAETNHEYPVLAGAARSELVSSWGEFTPDTVDLNALAANRPVSVRITEEVNFDG